ncbi:MAG TPA: NIPSNAP family protein [Rhizomicrobium sp.]|jgi:hypothetical protein
MNRIIELRQYTLKPGARDTLIELFEREFVESQEAVGMDVIGTFRDADNPDRFAWLRGFADMESRARALATFYSGPVWKEHRGAAVATMEDTDNVLLLRPAWSGSGFSVGGTRAPCGASDLPGYCVIAAICHFDQAVPESFIESFRKLMPQHCEAAGAELIAALESESSANTYPALQCARASRSSSGSCTFPTRRPRAPFRFRPNLSDSCRSRWSSCDCALPPARDDRVRVQCYEGERRKLPRPRLVGTFNAVDYYLMLTFAIGWTGDCHC